MKRKNAVKNGKRNKGKKRVPNKKKDFRRQQKEEIISKEELENREGISGDTTVVLIALLKVFLDGDFISCNSTKLIGLAKYIYKHKILYTPKHDGYKLMELSSISAELGALRKSVEKEYTKDKEEKRKTEKILKSKY